MDIAYCMAMTLISSKVYLILNLGSLNIVSTLSLEAVYVAALARTNHDDY